LAEMGEGLMLAGIANPTALEALRVEEA